MYDYLINYCKYRIIGNSIRIDASSICQLKCVKCFQSQDENRIKRCYLKFCDFKKFVDDNPTFRNIELSDNGEIFLNPELKEIIEYGFKKGIDLTARNGVNLNTASEEVLECLVKYKFKIMSVSIDGATNNTYQIYRRGGNLDNVIENIKRINFYKQKYNSKFPKLIWQFIIFGHNENELLEARRMAKKLNMRFFIKLNWSESYSPVKDKELIKRETKYASRQEYEEKAKASYSFPCHQLWLAPQISPDNELLGCCNNSSSNTFGNVSRLGLQKCLRGERFIYAKKMLLGRVKGREDIPCFQCSKYKKIQSHKISLVGNFLKLQMRIKGVYFK